MLPFLDALNFFFVLVQEAPQPVVSFISVVFIIFIFVALLRYFLGG